MPAILLLVPLSFWTMRRLCSEKATKVCEIFTLLLSYVVPVKSKVEISQNFVAFSEYMNFITLTIGFESGSDCPGKCATIEKVFWVQFLSARHSPLKLHSGKNVPYCV